MAKRKAVRGSGRTSAARGRSGGQARAAAKKRTRAAAKKTGASRKIARKAAKKATRKATVTARASRKAPARRAKPVARPRTATKTAKAKKSAARKAPVLKANAKTKARAKAPARTSSAAPSRGAAAKNVRQPPRTAPSLNRERKTITDVDVVPSPPSSLDLDRTASAARSGRRELREKYEEHTETGPALTGGDVDADWESAYSVGDEAPGGDNPTPDQDIVDDIGRAVGVEYQDNEELKGERKISDRDKHRWELDPASSDDWDDR
jgi:hypothetical protein